MIQVKNATIALMTPTSTNRLLGTLCAVTLISTGILGYLYYTQSQLLTATEQTLEARNKEVARLESNLADSLREGEFLAEALDTEQRKNEDFEDQIDDLADTIGVLDKLARIDKELLQKYSKVYFLNEHYTPQKLKRIDQDYVYDPVDDEFFLADALPFLNDLLEEAEDDKINLRVISAFRSFDEQTELKGNYTVTYGSGANTFSADQGYSEHQLGTTVDFATQEGAGTLTTAFAATDAYNWLEKNAYKYGFVLSYPEGNTYYQFEPWHWRFVGKDLARDLRSDDQYFYDLSQRDIDEYLIDLFD